MRTLLALLLFAPFAAQAQSNDPYDRIFRESFGLPPAQQQQPSAGIAVQPIIPVPQDRGPWGTGYSVVTTTRPQRNLWDRDVVGSETVQRVVPNDAVGQPMRGLDFGGFYGR